MTLSAHIQPEVERAHREIVHRLRRVVELRDDEAPGHVERMSSYCALTAQNLGLGSDEAESIALASTLHDAGKVALPEAILLKEGKLTSHERKVMEQHTVMGHRLLTGSESPLLETAATVAWTHHEKWDGSGYPRAMAGDEIPLEGRIAAVADVFDALVTDRPYRAALQPEEALDVIRSERGRHFAPDVLDAFLRGTADVVAVMREPYVGSPFAARAGASGNGAASSPHGAR
jgi:putative two-component system response regulator